MVHKQGIKAVSDERLQRRNGVYYYRRRVPLHLVKAIGRKVVQVSLHTTSFKEARKLRTIRDLEWDARFEAADPASTQTVGSPSSHPLAPPALAEAELIQLVRDYVARQDREAVKRDATGYPANADERTEMTQEAGFEAQTLRARDNEQTHQWVYLTGHAILKATGRSFEDPGTWRGSGGTSSARAPGAQPAAACSAGRRPQQEILRPAIRSRPSGRGSVRQACRTVPATP